jgi:N6-adenosine-specific RNA methylase IME4
MRYHTIVADPPWKYGKFAGLPWREGNPSGSRRPLPYPQMTLEAITALPVADLAEDAAHLYLWTTNRYLRASYAVCEAWGFSPGKLLTWCKAPTGFAMGDAWGSASEFCLFAKRGTLPALTRIPRDWWEWPRGAHSQKPEAFLDLVEQVSPGPRLEMFARRQRLGWDTWGNEALEHVEIDAA